MNQAEAEKLLGGHATGTLTDDERRILFAAALKHQAIFDALMDEEALRELLADPAAKAQLIAALSPAAAPKVVPFWRRTGVLGAAAGLMVAATAGLAYLRSPERVHPPLEQEREQPAKAKVTEPPAVAQAPTLLARKAPAPPAQASVAATPAQETAANLAPPPPKPVTAAGAAPTVESDLRAKEQDQYRTAEARDQLAKKAEAPRPAAALLEVAPAPRAEKQKGSTDSQNATADALPGGTIGGLVSGVASRTAADEQAVTTRGDASSSLAAPAPAKSARRVDAKTAAASAPTWTLEPLPDGTTRVLVRGPLGATAVLLRRRASEVEVLALKMVDSGGDLTHWRAQVRLAAGDVLDLYLLNATVADPAKLPETGPVDGFRARIFPAAR